MNKFKRGVNTVYIWLRRLLSLLIFIPISVTIHCWINIFYKIPARQVFLNLGSQFFKIGAGFKIGDPQHVPVGTNGKTMLRYIKNIYFNFYQNKLTVSYTDKPHLIKKNESRK